MDATSRLALIRVKIERAKRHYAELIAAVDSGVLDNSKVVSVQRRGSGLHDLLTIPEAPFNLLAVGGDVIQNLRSSLDHLAYHLVQVGTPGVEPHSYVAFPIYVSQETYKKKKGRRVYGMRQDAIDAIDALKPWKGGNELLWALNRLNNIDKHRFILTIEHDYLFTGEHFEGSYLMRSDNPIFSGVIGDDGLALMPMLAALITYVDNLVTSLGTHLV